jgi:hypothetical protein
MLRIVSELYVRLPPHFSVNTDSKGLQMFCFAALLQMLILNDLAKMGLWGLSES